MREIANQVTSRSLETSSCEVSGFANSSHFVSGEIFGWFVRRILNPQIFPQGTNPDGMRNLPSGSTLRDLSVAAHTFVNQSAFLFV